MSFKSVNTKVNSVQGTSHLSSSLKHQGSASQSFATKVNESTDSGTIQQHSKGIIIPSSQQSSQTSSTSGSSLKRKFGTSSNNGSPSPAAGVVGTTNTTVNTCKSFASSSQPNDTGMGSVLLTNMVYALDYLRSKDRAVTFDEIYDYLSLGANPNTARLRNSLFTALSSHPRVQYTCIKSEGDGEVGTFSFKPKHNVRNQTELLEFLKKQKSAKGILVKDLKDGWPTAAKAVDELEKLGQALVSRNRKDNTPRMVWLDDPSLRPNTISPEFAAMWDRMRLPANPEELREKLELAGLKPTTAPKVTMPVVKKDKKRKPPRKSTRQTNTHMLGILRDYSHKRK